MEKKGEAHLIGQNLHDLEYEQSFVTAQTDDGYIYILNFSVYFMYKDLTLAYNWGFKCYSHAIRWGIFFFKPAVSLLF